MFCACYDHQTEEKASFRPFGREAHQYLIVFEAISYCSLSMLLTLVAFAQPSGVHAGPGCCVAIDFPGMGLSTLVMLLLDQIKPIEQLVPVS